MAQICKRFEQVLYAERLRRTGRPGKVISQRLQVKYNISQATAYRRMTDGAYLTEAMLTNLSDLASEVAKHEPV